MSGKHQMPTQSQEPMTHRAGNTHQPTGSFPAEYIETINGTFELLAAGYGNQYTSAYPDLERIKLAKRMWAKHLKDYPYHLILKVADEIISKERYLPNIATFRQYCDASYNLFGLLTAEQAYTEACCASLPRSKFKWSHSAVFLAGEASDWFFLTTEPRDTAFPVFKRYYEILCQRVINGEDLKVPVAKAIPETISRPLDRKENLGKLKGLRSQLKL